MGAYDAVPNRAPRPKLIRDGSLEDLLTSYAEVKSHGKAQYQARKNDKRLAGEKQHAHKFHIGDQESASINPDSLATYIPCYVDGCTAELHPTESGLEVHHNGTQKPFKGTVERD